MIAIHFQDEGFTSHWIKYCEENNISFKIVDCYDNDIISNLAGCVALFWHFQHTRLTDILMAKELFFTLHHLGIKTFPDWASMWHFDDKIAQKYLLESAGVPIVPTKVFYDKKTTIDFLHQTKYPIVWKLRRGAGSSNVKLLENFGQAKSFVNRAFKVGFSSFNSSDQLKERWRRYCEGNGSISELLRGTARYFIKPRFASLNSKEAGYFYFQEFLPNNKFDIRIIVIGNKAFGLKRYVRDGDFRASGSGRFAHDRKEFDVRCVSIAFQTSKLLKASCLAYDFVFNEDNEPLIVEISFGFSPHGYFDCPGYWDDNLNWAEGKFNPYGWMVELILEQN